jgi:hypothetical protein
MNYWLIHFLFGGFTMHNFSSKTLGALLLTTLLVVAACSSSTASPVVGQATNSTGSGTLPTNMAPTNNPMVSASDLGLTGAANAFSNVSSYKFTMALAGGTFSNSLGALGGSTASTGNAGFTMSGTVVEGNNPAADVKIGGLEMIEIGGFQYVSLGAGGFIKTASSGTSLTDSFSPSQMFTSMIDTSTYSGYTKVGSEAKNGVQTDHYQANQTVLSQYGVMAGTATGATWSGDVWIAQGGGYPVSMNITAKAADNSVAYQILFDVTNVNDPANTVTVPTNVTSY